MESYKMLINGKLVEAKNNEVRYSFDPGNGEIVDAYTYGTIEDADIAVNSAYEAFNSGVWARLSPRQRAEILIDLANLIMKNAPKIAQLEALDSGGLIQRTYFDVMQSVRFIRRMAIFAASKFPWKEDLPKGALINPSTNYILREPIGVCVAIIPWNFPFLMAVWKITMATLAGNTIVLKPSPETPLSALYLGELIKQCNFPPGVINIITGDGKEIGEFLTKHSKVDKISFTGSTAVGEQIYTNAAKGIKRLNLELGGKSANIVLADADMDMAVDGAIFAAFLHAGQVCESGTRLFLPEKISSDFINELVRRTEKIKVGYQLLPDITMGPVINGERLKKITECIETGEKEGANIVTGGKQVYIKGFEKGNYLLPTIFTNVSPEMTIATEEIFGPVLAISTYNNESELIELANSTRYGLAAGIWSRNFVRAEEITRQLRAGTVWINDWHIFHEFGPFGGYKQSGFDREFGKQGLESYTETKHVHIGTQAEANAKTGHRTMVQRETPMGYDFNIPTKIIAGPGSIAHLKSEINQFGNKKFMLITDEGVKNSGIVDRLLNVVGHQIAVTFDKVIQDIYLEMIDQIASVGKNINIEGIISIGGGSVIDTGKAVSIALGMDIPASFVVGMNHLDGERLPHIVIPTTAGTGSEVTNVAVLFNEKIKQKVMIFDAIVFPDLAILDPCLTTSLSPTLTVQGAFDALTHAIEAYVSTKANPTTDALSLQSIALIFDNLEKVLHEGNNLAHRMQLMTAANLAGMAIAEARVGIVHALSHALGVICKVPHGLANAVMLTTGMNWNSEIPEIRKKYISIAKHLNIAKGTSEEETFQNLIHKIRSLLEVSHIQEQMKNYAVTEKDLPLMASTAFNDPSLLTNPRKVKSLSEIEHLLKIALFD